MLRLTGLGSVCGQYHGDGSLSLLARPGFGGWPVWDLKEARLLGTIVLASKRGQTP